MLVYIDHQKQIQNRDDLKKLISFVSDSVFSCNTTYGMKK